MFPKRLGVNKSHAVCSKVIVDLLFSSEDNRTTTVSEKEAEDKNRRWPTWLIFSRTWSWQITYPPVLFVEIEATEIFHGMV